MWNNLTWFKDNVIPFLKDYKIDYFFFEQGDFGDLNRVEFEGSSVGGNVDFWELNWLEIHVYDYSNEKELIDVMLSPDQEKEQESKLEELRILLLYS